LNVETGKKISAAKAREILANAPGLKLMDDVSKNVFPMPSEAAGQDMVFVGRIREDESIKNGLNLWLVADNIRNRASNAVRIAELLIEKHLKR
jgi:aspartate-semialdehyde dehydrogenase